MICHRLNDDKIVSLIWVSSRTQAARSFASRKLSLIVHGYRLGRRVRRLSFDRAATEILFRWFWIDMAILQTTRSSRSRNDNRNANVRFCAEIGNLNLAEVGHGHKPYVFCPSGLSRQNLRELVGSRQSACLRNSKNTLVPHTRTYHTPINHHCQLVSSCIRPSGS